MRKFGKESTAPEEGVNRESGKGWLQNHCALAVCIVAILALVLRTVFAYGISADGGFALSGGAEAQYHLHAVESILNGSFIVGSDAAINYPVGGLNLNPPLYDVIAAAVGSVSSASTGLAVLAPIFGALTVFPIYLVGKELAGYKVGFVAALIYGLMALPICSSVFSNGTEYAFAAFLFAFFTLMMIKVVRNINDNQLVIKDVIIAGIFLGLIALSWNGFRAVLVMLIIIMVIQLVLDRFNSKDFSVPLYSYSIIMLIGVLLGALYYIPAGLWDAVFSGPVLITVIAIAFGFVFKALQNSPWIFTIPGLVVAFIIIAAVLFFAAPDYYTALIFGNSAITNPIMADLSNIGVTISKMSSYYGWFLMWMPIVLGIYEFYVYARKDRSHTQLFLTMWLLVGWVFSWTSYGAAVVMGPIYAISSAMVILDLLKAADLRTWFSNMKSAGFPGFLKKMIKPLPFISVLVLAFLVIAPGLVFAVDAGISSNDDYGYPFYGNTVYTIETGEGYPYSYTYDDLEGQDKSMAVVSWIDSSTDIAAHGFKTVNDSLGTGASAAAQIYLADGGAGATAAQIVRLMMSSNTDVSSAFSGYSSVYNQVKSYIDDPASAKDLVLSDPDKYGSLDATITEENAVYIASVESITDGMSTGAIFKAYESVCSKTNEQIGYYVLDGTMVPFMYGDGSTLSTIAYFAGYNSDNLGAIPEYFSYSTYYSYYPAIATSALFDTFLWKAIIGPSPSDAGYTNSFSYLYDLTASNGSVKAMPGYGLAGYEIVSWNVMYNSDPKATTSDDGWEYMSYTDASSKQKSEGGLINYLSSVITYKYVGSSSGQISGKVVNEFGEALSGITVSVTSFNSVFDADTVYSETKTDADGGYSLSAPSGNYYVTYKNGSVQLETSTSGSNVVVESSQFEGTVVVGSELDVNTGYLYVLKKDGEEYLMPVTDGKFYSSDAVDANGKSVRLVPGSYSYELRNSSASAVSSGTVTLYAGYNTGLTVSPTSYTITATVNDVNGQKVDGGVLAATNASTGKVYYGDVSGGTAVIYVPSGTYNVMMQDGYTSASTSSLSVTSNRTTTVTAYSAIPVSITKDDSVSLTLIGGDYSAKIGSTGQIGIPTSIGATSSLFTIYGVDSEYVYHAVYAGGSSVEVQKSAPAKVSGSIGVAGTVTFMNSDGFTVSAAADSNGKFEIVLPVGEYTVYASNSDSTTAYYGNVDITGDVSLRDFTMSAARKITATYQYASNTSKGNVNLPFAVMEIVFTYDGKEWTIPSVSNTTGKSIFVIPDSATSIKVTANGGSIDNDMFGSTALSKTVTDGDSDATVSITISAAETKKVTVTADYVMTLDPYHTGDEIEFNKSAELAPGQYTAEINAASGSYFRGTVYVYPGATTFTGLNPIEVYGVKITKGSLDELTITGEKSHDNYNDDDVYYFEYDCEYFLKTENSSTGLMKLGYVDDSYAKSEVETIDMTTDARAMTITGFVGAVGDGTLTVTYDATVVEAKIEGGAFEVVLPNNVTTATFRAEVTKTVSSNEYGFSGETTVTGLKDEMIVNVPVVSDDSVVKHTSALDAKLDSVKFDKGKATVGITIYNNNDLAKTYTVSSGSAWTLDKAVQVVVPANDQVSLTVTGVYEPQGTGVGSQGMTIKVSDYNGSASKTLYIIDGEITPSESIIEFKSAAESTNKDMVSGNEYLYALTFTNTGAENEVTIDATVSGDYSVVLMNSNGTLIKENGGTFVIPAQNSTVIYAKVMGETGNMDKAPSIRIDSSAGSKSLTPSSMEISVDSVSVSGDSAVLEKSGVPLGVWFIFGLSIILLILIVWMGSKRGVFSRR